MLYFTGKIIYLNKQQYADLSETCPPYASMENWKLKNGGGDDSEEEEGDDGMLITVIVFVQVIKKQLQYIMFVFEKN